MYLNREGLFFDESWVSNVPFYDEKVSTLVCYSGKDIIPFRPYVSVDSSEGECLRGKRLDSEFKLMFESFFHECAWCFSVLAENKTGVF